MTDAKVTGRFGAPPSAAQVRHNIKTPAADAAGKARFINFRVPNERFIEIKTAALHQGMSLADYLVQAHEAYQKKRS